MTTTPAAAPQVTSFPKDQIEIVLLEGVHDSASELLEAEGFRIRRETGSLEGDDLAAAIGDAHVVGIRSKTQLTADILAAGRRLLAVGAFCIGTNQIDLRAAAAAGVPVFNAPFGNTRSVAELTIAEVVMLSRRIPERTGQMHAGRWVKSASGAHEVRGKTLGIVGYGHIGAQVSVLAEAMGMRVLFYDVVPKLPLGNARAAGSLGELLEQADAVTLHVPADETTRGMIGAAELARMKPTAHLLNNARGSIVDIDALAGAIREGRLAGAAIDVFPAEPADREADFTGPLTGLGNVILTPHIGGSTQEAQQNIGLEVGATLATFINNGSTTGAVNVPEVDLPDQSRQLAGGRRAHRVLHFHRNVPGVLSQIHGAISELGVNVAGEYLRTDERIGYVVLDVDPSAGDELKKRLDAIPETIRTRMLW